YWFTRFSDGDFTHGAALSRTIGTAMMRLASADILPFEFRSTANTLRGYAGEVEKLAPADRQLDLSPLTAAIATLATAADAYDKTQSRSVQSKVSTETLAEVNRVIYSTEREFRYEAGLPRREWFKHLAYAPGFYTGYGVKTLPGIREAIEQKQWDEARSFIPIVAGAIDKLTADVDKARGLLERTGKTH